MNLTKINEFLTNKLKNVNTKSIREFKNRYIKSKNPRQTLYAGIAGAALIITLGVAIFGISDKAIAVTVNGKQVAVVKDKVVAEKLIKDLIEEKNRQSGLKVGVADNITYEKIAANNSNIDNLPSLKKKLNEGLNFITTGVAIKINGRPEIILANKTDAKKLIETLKKENMGQLTDVQVESVSFAEKVELAETKVDISDIIKAEDALELLRNGRNKKVIHVVKQGDNLWTIARANDLRVKEILAANPQIKSDKLDLGQELNLVKVEPLVNVVSVIKASTTEEIPYQIKVKQDKKLTKGQEKVLQEGIIGSKDVTYKLVLRNGQEVERKVLASKVTKQPKEKIVARGARRYANTMVASRGGLGRFIWPLQGMVTSKYGWRWGRPHKGIDIDGRTGDPVGASAAGRVIRSGWYAAYGKTVDIDHGNGYVTRYAHFSTVNVKAGEQVDKGELVGRVGTTGNATGSSLHFEVISRGASLNPLGYLR
ncbi:MAG: peptidoglycan DD-metalloendopeptidase family protein [Clostridia bacterium]|nr:peptidoglycan DD-metalloendopeptidase family protein [Clostridia bacterium]